MTVPSRSVVTGRLPGVLRVVLTTLVLLTALAACRPATGPEVVADSALPVPAGAQEATVVRSVDGDTVVLRGRGAGPLPAQPTRVRILLIDTPEVVEQQECFGEEAAARTADLLPDGARVRVEADRQARDRFDRTLLHVWNEDGVHVGAELLRGGHATVLFLRPNDRYLDQLRTAEREARQAGRGLWSACARN